MLKKSLLALLLVLFGNQLALSGPVHKSGANAAYQLVQQNPSISLLDVGTSQGFRQFRLAGAALVPNDNLLACERELPGDRPTLVDCEVGHCSAQVVDYLARRGYL
ncbi:MAG TPA: hypothetical protein VJ995_09065 [Geothermobacteraceae bacterium]|nr:hypothetical protein [Geothermobacteraceae bacterium]